MKYNEAMKIDSKGWRKAVEEEHQQMIDNNVWRRMQWKDIAKEIKIRTSTWACKLKSNGGKLAQINARGFEQVDGMYMMEVPFMHQ